MNLLQKKHIEVCMKSILFISLFASSFSFASAIGDSLSQVNLKCEGTIYHRDNDQSVKEIVSVDKKEISVINPWYGSYGEQRALKEPQDIIVYDTLAATVKKSINSEKEIVLEVYSINPINQHRDRVAFAAGEATINGLGVSMNVSVGKYETLFRCKEANLK